MHVELMHLMRNDHAGSLIKLDYVAHVGHILVLRYSNIDSSMYYSNFHVDEDGPRSCLVVVLNPGGSRLNPV